MRTLMHFISLCAMAYAAGCCDAASQPEQLNGLFDQLQHAESQVQAAVVEQQIWDLWYQGPNEAAHKQMIAGIEAMERGDLAAALLLYDDLIHHEPGYAEAWNKRATIYWLLGNIPQSLADIHKTIELEPRHFGALSGLAMILVHQNQYLPVLNVYRQLLTINPQSEINQKNLQLIERLLREQMI